MYNFSCSDIGGVDITQESHARCSAW